MEYSATLSLECPHCDTRCQFTEIPNSHEYCRHDRFHHHIAFVCTNCNGLIVTRWYSINNIKIFRSTRNNLRMLYHPPGGGWRPRVNLSCIESEEVKEDFLEAIKCYNSGYYNASMLLSRRAIQQDVLNQGVEKCHLYKQIESTGISDKLKSLLHKVKNFGNYAGHPDFFLFDDDENKIDDKKQFAKLSLEFLDSYFFDQYQIDALVQNAPKSDKELNSGD